jgi:hypothetical protein
MHRNIYRGKELGNSLTADQLKAIGDGTFEDLYIGDYWEKNGVKYTIADFDYWLGTGNNKPTEHHAVIVVDVPEEGNVTSHPGGITTTSGNNYAQWVKDSVSAWDTDVGGFVPSGGYLMDHEDYIVKTFTNAKGILGSDVVNIYPDYTSEDPDALIGKVVDRSVGLADPAVVTELSVMKTNLLNEPMVFGSYIHTAMGVCRYTTSGTQLALFRLRPSLITTGYRYWLRGVFDMRRLVAVQDSGVAYYIDSADTNKNNKKARLRLVFALKGVQPS